MPQSPTGYRTPALTFLFATGFLATATCPVEAGDRFIRRARPAQYNRAVAPTAGPGGTPVLGTFYPTNYLVATGNNPTAGGYAPLGSFGEQSALSVYGPLSSYRETVAPVNVYSRGYDGRVYQVEANSFSTPNRPSISPVVYPTRANYFYSPRTRQTPPQWDNAINWIDQN